MQFRRTYEVVKLVKPWPARFNEQEKLFGLREIVEGKVKKILGEDYSFDAFSTAEEAQKVADNKNNTFYLSDYSSQEIEDFFNSIDFEPVYDKLREITGYKDLTFTKKLQANMNNLLEHFEIESEQNLADTNKFIRVAWKNFRIATFNADICLDKVGKLKIWGNFDYMYESQDFGHNGTRILNFEYSQDEGWKIQSAEERRKFLDEQDRF